MDKVEFEREFEQTVGHLFERMGGRWRGRSLLIDQGPHTIQLSRWGGNFTQPGAIVHTVFCRHACNRTLNEQVVPARPHWATADYPWVMEPALLSRTGPDQWAFAAERVFHKPKSVYRFDNRSLLAVHEDLLELCAGLERYLGWFTAMTPEQAVAQLADHPDFWAARLWVEDYEGGLG